MRDSITRMPLAIDLIDCDAVIVGNHGLDLTYICGGSFLFRTIKFAVPS